MMTDESIDVTPRRRPVQARSRERVGNILSHAAAIFHENGVDGTSMSAIARQSGMSLASLYRYFPNKAAIVHAIAEGHVEKMETALREKLPELSLHDAVDVLIDQFYDFYRTEPAYSAIWSGVESMPELRELDLRELYSNARDLMPGSSRSIRRCRKSAAGPPACCCPDLPEPFSGSQPPCRTTRGSSWWWS